MDDASLCSDRRLGRVVEPIRLALIASWSARQVLDQSARTALRRSRRSLTSTVAGVHLEELSREVEAVSSLYAQRHAIERDPTWFLLKLQEEVGELTQFFLMKTGRARDKGDTPEQLDAAFRSELADVFSQVLLLAHHQHIDLQAEVEAKWLRWNPDWVRRHLPGRGCSADAARHT